MNYTSVYTNNDTASVYSEGQPASEFDENGDPMRRAASSSKAATLANEIAGMEQLVARLEERNKWLTTKLMTNRRKFIETHFMKSASGTLTRSLDAWRQIMTQLRVEGQLDKQTAALDQCQQVAKELGAALSQEQQGRKRAEDAARALRSELDRVLEFNQGLQQQGDVAIRRNGILEKRLEESELKIKSIKVDAQNIVDNMELWAVRGGDPQNKRDKAPNENEDFIERSERIRNEAKDVIKNVSGQVPVPSRQATPSPDRPQPPGRTNSRQQPGSYTNISRYDGESRAR